MTVQHQLVRAHAALLGNLCQLFFVVGGPPRWRGQRSDGVRGEIERLQDGMFPAAHHRSSR
jgi:hypothetical protein